MPPPTCLASARCLAAAIARFPPVFPYCCSSYNKHQARSLSLLIILLLVLLWLLVDQRDQVLLQLVLVLRQSVLLPGVVKHGGVKVVALHAVLEESNACLVVWLLFKLKRSGVLHELFEFRWLSTAKLLKRCLDLLLFNCSILLILASTWETLPWQRSHEHVQQHVANALEIIAS